MSASADTASTLSLTLEAVVTYAALRAALLDMGYHVQPLGDPAGSVLFRHLSHPGRYVVVGFDAEKALPIAEYHRACRVIQAARLITLPAFNALLLRPQERDPCPICGWKRTQTELAKAEFLERVQMLPIWGLRQSEDEALVERTIRVAVPAIRHPLFRAVVGLQGEMYRKYPKARLNIDIVGCQERGIAQDEVETAYW